MAQLQVESDPFLPGRWMLRSEHPSTLAAIPDAIIQVLNLENDVLSAWAVHYDEQNEHAENAYTNELREIDFKAQSEVIILPRAPTPNVVWIDRQHLVVGAGSPTIASRLLGLYVGSNGSITIAISNPSVAGQVHTNLRAMIGESTNEPWNSDAFVGLNRVVIRYDALSLHGEKPTNIVAVRAPQPMALAVQGALLQLVQAVEAW